MRTADELPTAEVKDSPESPYSHDWERVWEPTFVPPKGEHRRNITYLSGRGIPETDIQALMETAPFQDPETSLESMAHMRDEIADAIDELEPRLRWIFEARVYRGLSIRQVAAELNLAKSYVARLHEKAINQLRTALEDLVAE